VQFLSKKKCKKSLTITEEGTISEVVTTISSEGGESQWQRVKKRQRKKLLKRKQLRNLHQKNEDNCADIAE
jgi:hypothetical protein